jgi:hypothetical protein
MKTTQLYVTALLFGLLLGPAPHSLMAQAPTSTVGMVPLSAKESASPLALDEVLCRALDLSETETTAFLPLLGRYGRDLLRLQKKYPFLWGDTPLMDSSVSEEEAWLGMASLMGYQKAHARLQRQMARRLSRLLDPRKVAQFFLLERGANPVIEREGDDLMTIRQTD